MYKGIDNLGITYSPAETKFRVWAPERKKIEVLLYEDWKGENKEVFEMDKLDDGVHQCTIKGDLNGKYYTYLVETLYEVTDPYSVASSLDSKRSAIIDLEETNPEGWGAHKIPPRIWKCEEIIYELHIKDFTVHPSSGVKHRGKYLGLCEEGTSYNGLSTGIDHLKELGITCVHLMPVFDFFTVIEDRKCFYCEYNYNWGYDPELYNVPEGSYATDPEDPKNRILELKTLIMKLHEANIKVIMDVVYNHTYLAENSNFNILYPGYYYRLNEDGSFSNGSGCGNELATEKPMVRKFILDSVKFWLEEYKMDGFRFDLMALIDKDTMKEIVAYLKGAKRDVIIYGEPWAAGPTVLPHDKMSIKGIQDELDIAIFNGDYRDAVKGDSDGYIRGFSQGNMKHKIDVETGIIARFYEFPHRSINYINSHDNLILYDKMKKVFGSGSEGEIVMYNKFALSILFTSQGVPFIHAGNEFLRTKYMHKNSYNSPVSVNQIDWSLKDRNLNFYNYVKDLIKIRKTYKEFTMVNPAEIGRKIKFLDMGLQSNLIVYTINRKITCESLLVIHNGNDSEVTIQISNLISHMRYWYNIKPESITLTEIFNNDGIVQHRHDLTDPNEIYIQRFSTYIYEIAVYGDGYCII
ncbi:MAG: type I pullulanase [Natronincolaceae bacterium]|jgi:type I pullulanase|nr:type I pullulanase [Bacillota bacterium]NLK90872.1 type I pullulanase [Clostridiales bacterium]